MLIIFLLLLFCTINCYDGKALPIPQMSDLARLRANIHYTIARQHDSLEFLCDQTQPILLWVLPNNLIIRLNQSIDEEVIDFQDSSIIVSKHTLKIPSIEQKMDGQYTCLVEDGKQFHFYVLQVSPKINFFNAIAMSLTISIGFALICITVLFLDKYCSRPGAIVRPVSNRLEDPLIYRQWL